jgi:hypothetical protein
MRLPTPLQSDADGQRTGRSEREPGPRVQAGGVDDSPRVAAQRSVAEGIQNSPKVAAARERQQALTGGGLPARLRAGIEALSSLSMDGVRVHYNSARPAQLQAHAYAQGADIHLGPGQERHLPHEAWHVVQQAQGRVRPTIQAKGLPVNDDEQLEREADHMGERAMRIGDRPWAGGGLDAPPPLPVGALRLATVQREEDETEPPDGEPVNAEAATRVGVQLTLRKDGLVANVLVAGRPQSPFSGTMGDHVTAFGVHVINLRQAMEGHTLDDARGGLVKLITAMRGLKGMDYVADRAGEWKRRKEQLAVAEQEAAATSEDEKLAQLQWMAALYLEVREGVPFSLVNTRAMTAISGRGHGEASQLGNLLAYGSGKRSNSKKKAKTEGEADASEEEIDIASKLFDEAAVALVTFNHSVGNFDEVKTMLPAHVDAAKLADMNTGDLMAQIVSQHVASVFPLAGSKAAAIEKAVFAKLFAAHEARRTGDLGYWKDKLDSARLRIVKARTDVSGTVTKDWADTYARAAATDMRSALELVAKLLAYAVPDVAKDKTKPAFVAGLNTHLPNLGPKLDAAAELVWAQPKRLSGSLIGAYYAYLGTVDAFCVKVDKAFFSKKKQVDMAFAESEPAKDMIDQFAVVETQRAVVEKKVEEHEKKKAEEQEKKKAEEEEKKKAEEQEKKKAEEARLERERAMDTTAVTEDQALGTVEAETHEPNPLKRKAVDEEEEKQAKPVAPKGFIDLERQVVTVRRRENLASLEPTNRAAKTRVDEVTGDLSRSIGNSFTVSLRLKEGRIDSVAMRGRPPSPFRGTMGAHATAWLVWVNALTRQLEKATLKEAGSRLLKFADILIQDARQQTEPVAKAQNARRREAAKWDGFSLDAWEDHLTSLIPPNGAWTVGLVQAYAQAILTCANQLPGTTRADKNTDGHGEADAWQKAKLDYANESTRDKALEGSGLFDASTNSSVRPRHLWLMALALGHHKLDEPVSGQQAEDEEMHEEKQPESAATPGASIGKEDELENIATMLD